MLTNDDTQTEFNTPFISVHFSYQKIPRTPELFIGPTLHCVESIIFFFFFPSIWTLCKAWRTPPPGIKPMCLQWKCGVLTAGSPGKSYNLFGCFLNPYSSKNFPLVALKLKVNNQGNLLHPQTLL